MRPWERLTWLVVDRMLLVRDTLTIDKRAGRGIKVDTNAPTFGWRDIIGDVAPKASQPNAATLAAYRGGQYRAWFYGSGDLCNMVFHIPHDYAPGTDLHLHLHWGHNGTAISGQLVMTLGVTYSKGHDQAAFAAEVAPTITVSTPNIATVPQYRHRIDEIQLSATSPSATQIDTDLIEPDGLILVGMVATEVPTITGGSTNLPALFTLDVHYQSTNIATKQKSPSFYV